MACQWYCTVMMLPGINLHLGSALMWWKEFCLGTGTSTSNHSARVRIVVSDFLMNRTTFCWRRQACQLSNMASSGLKKMFDNWWKLVSSNKNWSCSWENHLLHYQNRMRSLHLHTELGLFWRLLQIFHELVLGISPLYLDPKAWDPSLVEVIMNTHAWWVLCSLPHPSSSETYLLNVFLL